MVAYGTWGPRAALPAASHTVQLQCHPSAAGMPQHPPGCLLQSMAPTLQLPPGQSGELKKKTATGNARSRVVFLLLVIKCIHCVLHCLLHHNKQRGAAAGMCCAPPNTGTLQNGNPTAPQPNVPRLGCRKLQPWCQALSLSILL